jgi:hypothetical protein
MKNPSGSHFISIDSVPRSHRDSARDSVEAAGRLMAEYPHSAVAVKDLQSGGEGRGQLQARSQPALMALTTRPIDHELISRRSSSCWAPQPAGHVAVGPSVARM